MSKKRTIWDKDRFPPIIVFAIATLFITPIISAFVFPPDSQMPIIISAYLTLFWILVTCGWIWWMIIGIYWERKSKQKSIVDAVHGQGNTIRMKNGMVADLDILRPARHEELMIALALAGGGDEKALKKLNMRAFWAVFKYATWISVMLLLIPFVALGYIHPTIIVGWIFLIFAHIPYSYLRDLLHNDENFYESAAMGLTLDKSNQIATGTRYGRNVSISFFEFGTETIVSGDAGTFQSRMQKTNFSKGEIPQEVQDLFDLLISKKHDKLWKRASIKSTEKEITISRKYKFGEHNLEAGYWMCDLWLAEWLVSRKGI